MSKEKKFYNSLKDIFIGAKVEGVSGYVNLMRIKARYFEKIEDHLKREIEEKLKKYPNFREEFFDKLYSFFNRYFTQSGSILFKKTPFHYNVYEKIYTDKKDVILFWKTHNLFYVKTDRIFQNLEIEFDGFKFFFDVSNLEHKKAFEKRELVYELDKVRQDKTIVFKVYYSERGRKTKIDEIKRELKKKEIKITDEILEKAFRLFERQSEVDYFINKNAKEFLKEQFKLWLHNYIFEEEGKFSKERIEQLQILKNIAFKIIDFVSQFEDELLKIWKKPKFVLNSNYVITLDRIAKKGGWEIIEKIQKHKGWKEQVKEWKDLGILEKEPKDLIENTLTGKQLKKEYQFLPIDTKYFKDLELEILNSFDNLDQSLDGWLIKSENWQALNTILPKFKEKIQTIYIDPPFNKEQEADYFYSVKFKDATWITMLENRLRLARDLLKDTGSIFVRCDYNGNMYVRLLMNEIFGEENFRNEIVINRRKFQMLGGQTFSTRTETLWFYSKSEKLLFNKIRRKIPNPSWKPLLHLPGNREKPERYIAGKKILPPKGRHFGISQAALDIAYKEGRVRFNEKGEVEIFVDTEELNNNWTDIEGYSFTWGFPTENAEILLKRVIEISSNPKDIILDFFLGSGTTTAVAHKLGRKWIGVEMGDHFYTVVLPRMKKSFVL